MTAMQRPGKKENPEYQQKKVERLLSEAFAWEPEQPPTDFVARAMEKQAVEKRTPVLRKRGGVAWWGLGTVGVAAASVLFMITGKMPELTPIDNTPHVVATPIVAAPRPLTTAPVNAADKRVQQDTVRHTQTASVKPKPAPRSTEYSDNDDESDLRPRRTRRLRRPERETVRQIVSVKPPVTVSPVRQETVNPVEPVGEKIMATPASEMYETDDGRLLLPVVVTHTSADGKETTYTPTVVEMAYQPTDNI